MNSLYTFATYIMEMPFLVGLIFCAVGLIMFFFPPKSINLLCGYRTQNSMKSKENWDFAQRLSSIKMMQLGVFLMLFSCLKLGVKFSVNYEISISLIVLISVVLFLFFSVEKAIHKKFPKS